LNKKQTAPDGGKGIRTNSYWQTINQLNKKQTAPDGGKGIRTNSYWQTINQFNKKQTAPDGGERDKDQFILANYHSIE
jgi:hypothetical protein